MLYSSVLSLHLLFVMAWVATLFYLPRILVNVSEAQGEAAVEQRLLLMGRRLYRFGHTMFGLALLFGLLLWFGFGIAGGWLHAKLALVVLLLAYFIHGGRWLKRREAGGALPSPKMLRWYNELPVLLVLAVIFLVIAKPF